jgi:hypothetical protein
MFSSCGYGCGINGVRKTRKIGTDGDEEGSETLPVDTIVVSVASVWVVESRYIDVTALDEPVVRCDYT